MCGMLLAATGAVLGSAGICGFARFERDAVRRREHACCRDVRREGGLGRRRGARELSPRPPRNESRPDQRAFGLVRPPGRAHSFPLLSPFRSVKGTPPWHHRSSCGDTWSNRERSNGVWGMGWRTIREYPESPAARQPEPQAHEGRLLPNRGGLWASVRSNRGSASCQQRSGRARRAFWSAAQCLPAPPASRIRSLPFSFCAPLRPSSQR
jgi:hypothetical protein